MQYDYQDLELFHCSRCHGLTTESRCKHWDVPLVNQDDVETNPITGAEYVGG